MVFLCSSEKDLTTNTADFKVVAAIDIGSTSSWYASSKTDTFKTDPLDIRIDKSWMVGRSSYFPTKTATCILMKGDGSFKSLGHEAQEEYADIILNDEAKHYLFFDKFKMALYNNENISKEMMIKDVKGREKKAVDVFSLFIVELMKLVMKNYQEFEFNDIQWVLTVPSVWSDKAKEFMRHCAERIGVRGYRLIIALEPDAVSVYFQYLHTLKPTVVPKLDRRYMVVDIGGGTVDITAHEKTDDGDLIELCKSTGNDVGGSEVDYQFLALFRQIVNDRVMNTLLTDDRYIDSYFDILREIEKCKRNILASDNNKLHFRIPFSNLDTLCRDYNNKSLSETIASSKYSEKISLKGEHMSFLRSILLSLFAPVGDRISKEIRKVIEKDLQINMILLAGGLSKSPLIVKNIEDSFKGMKIIKLPEEYPADLAVVTGAVLYGHRPHFITSRITEYTYGRLMQPEFETEKHDPAKLITINGIDHCKDVFEILVPKNTRVNVNKKIRKEYKGMHKSQKEIRIAVYTTKKNQVDYVDDPECKLFCEVLVPLSESADKTRCVIVDFIFGKTEFLVEAFEKKTKLQYNVSVELK
ncbi:unnamed protein product [Mytilus coruscus]|uniref:HSPA12A n=1 Tax=Mytilus coruscus TaxID=42192 RepID=A0A6J8AAB8_MYTCO|nr:unnamed protein product [Mytilus coruscus]